MIAEPTQREKQYDAKPVDGGGWCRPIPCSALRAPHLSGSGLGLAQTGDPVARLPLAAFFQNGDPFKPFQDIALGAQGARCAQTSTAFQEIVALLLADGQAELPHHLQHILPHAALFARRLVA